MNLELFLSALRARLGLFVMVLAATVAAAAIVSVLIPPAYRATTSLLVDVRDEQSLSNVQRALMMPQERMTYMQTQMDVITSQKVAKRVAHDLQLAKDPQAQAKFANEDTGRGSIEEWLGDGLLSGLKVETSQSNIINVSYSSGDPEFAAAVANGFAKAYMDTMLELRVNPTRQAATWFDEQLKTLRANLEKAQAKLTDYHRKQGIVASDERNDVASSRLSELSSQLVKAQGQTFDLMTREQRAREFVRGGASPDRLPEVLSNPHIQKLNSELLLGEAKLQQLATQYGPNYPLYQRQAGENQALRQRLDAEMSKILTGMENARRQSQQHEQELQRAIATQRSQLLQDKVKRNDLAVLTRDVESAQQTYDAALKRSIVSRVESRANETSISLLAAATPPRRPYRPKLSLNLALAAIVGTILAVGVVIMGELMNRRVRLREDLDLGFDAPLLVVLNARHRGARQLPGARASSGRALPSPG
jgi:chain length determinant protein EpsF